LRDELAPGPLSGALGARIEQHESLAPGLETAVSYDGDTYDYRTWGEWLQSETATVVGRHESGVAAGEPAVVRNEHGDGHVAYVGVWPEVELADALSVALLERAGLPVGDQLPENVRLTERDGHTWIMNFRADAVSVDPGAAGIVLGGETVPGRDLAVVDGPAHEIEISADE
jgi:beta-galactosidase